MDFDFELLGEIAEHAPTAGGNFSFTNFGRAWIDNVQVTHWDNDQGAFVREPYNGGQLKPGHYIEFQLHQDIKEFNPALTFDKTWYVAVKDSGKRAKDKTDWGEITKPSVLTAFGDLRKFFKAMSGKGTYCAVEDVVTGRVNKKGYDITAPKFTAVFKNAKECKAAREAQSKKSEEFPPTEEGIPEAIVKQVTGLIQAVGEDQALQMIQSNPTSFGDYSAEELIAAAKAQSA